MANVSCDLLIDASSCLDVFPCCNWNADLYPWIVYQPWSTLLIIAVTAFPFVVPLLTCYFCMLLGRRQRGVISAAAAGDFLQASVSSTQPSSLRKGSQRDSRFDDSPTSFRSAVELLSVELKLVLEDLHANVPVHQVMQELQEGSKYLRPYDRDRRLAIISYRMVKDSGDNFSLDAPAFLSAIRAAQESEVECLWLDLWAYRGRPPWGTYIHSHFVGTLNLVMSLVSLVIWLPRSRPNVPGEYQERMWCSYEAAMVQARQLEVVQAGYPLSYRQELLGVASSYYADLAWWPTNEPELRTLGRINALFYARIWTLLASNVAWVCLYETEGYLVVIVLIAIRAIIGGIIWILARSLLRQTTSRATHGGRIIRLMRHAARCTHKGMVPAKSNTLLTLLRFRLPWLPAYDRRDAVTVSSLIVSHIDHNQQGVRVASKLDRLSRSIERISRSVHAKLRPVWQRKSRATSCKHESSVVTVSCENSEPAAVGAATCTSRQSAESSQVLEVMTEDTSAMVRCSLPASSIVSEQGLSTFAIALSTYLHAHLQPSPGDDPTGLSLREWLLMASIQLYDQGESFQHGGPPPPARPGLWIDSKLKIGAERPTVDLKQVRMNLKRSTSASSADDMSNSFTLARVSVKELGQCNWLFVHSASKHYCSTPAGVLNLNLNGDEWSWPVRPRRVLDGSGLIANVAIPLYFSLRMLNDLLWMATVIPVSSRGRNGSGFTDFMFLDVYGGSVTEILAGVSVLILCCARFVPCTEAGKYNLSLVAKGRIPLPMRPSAKLEVAFISAAALGIQIYFLFSPWVTHVASAELDVARVICQYLNLVLVSAGIGIEIGLSTLAAVGGAIKHRNAYLLFETTDRLWRRHQKFV